MPRLKIILRYKVLVKIEALDLPSQEERNLIKKLNVLTRLDNFAELIEEQLLDLGYYGIVEVKPEKQHEWFR